MKRSKIMITALAFVVAIASVFAVNGKKPYSASVFYWSNGTSGTCTQLAASNADFNIASPAGSQTATLKRSDGVAYQLYSNNLCTTQVKFK